MTSFERTGQELAARIVRSLGGNLSSESIAAWEKISLAIIEHFVAYGLGVIKADDVESTAIAGSPNSLPEGSAHSQLAELLRLVNVQQETTE